MKLKLALTALALTLTACDSQMPPEMQTNYISRTLLTFCIDVVNGPTPATGLSTGYAELTLLDRNVSSVHVLEGSLSIDASGQACGYIRQLNADGTPAPRWYTTPEAFLASAELVGLTLTLADGRIIDGRLTQIDLMTEAVPYAEAVFDLANPSLDDPGEIAVRDYFMQNLKINTGVRRAINAPVPFQYDAEAPIRNESRQTSRAAGA